MRMIFLYWMIMLHADNLHAQLAIGVEAGVSRNILATDLSNRPSTIKLSRTGFAAGILVNYKLNKRLALRIIPGVQQKNYSIQRTGAYTGMGEEVTNTYVHLPAMASVIWERKKYSFYGSAGLYGAYWLWGRASGAVPDIFNINGNYAGVARYDEKHFFDPRKDNRWEFGWATGIGAAYRINTSCAFYADARYYCSLADMQKKYMTNQAPMYNRTLSITAGFMFHPFRRK